MSVIATNNKISPNAQALASGRDPFEHTASWVPGSFAML
jgi:hypothetical protein